MAQGSCLCGQIRYEASEIGPDVTKCHCSLCRKASGSAHADITTAPIASFRWTAGEDKIKKYESSPGVFRNFCPNCGTHMPSAHEPLGIYFIQAGTLDSDENLVESMHIFVGSKVAWHALQPGLKEFQEYPG